MLTCLKELFIGNDDVFAYISVLIANWTDILCDGEFNEKLYIRKFRRLENDADSYLIKVLRRNL